MALEISRLCLFSRDVFPFQRPCWNGEHPRFRISLVAASRERAWEGGQASFMQGRTRLTHTLTHAREGGDRKKQRRRVGSPLQGGATRRLHGCYVCALGKQRRAKKATQDCRGGNICTHTPHAHSRNNTSMGVGCHLA